MKMSRTGVVSKNKISKEIIILSFITILYSLQGMPTLDFNAYYIKFYPSPQKLIFARHLLSIALRVVLIVSGIGIVFRKEIFRKIIIFTSFFIIVTICWKHPIIAVKNFLIWKIKEGVLPVSLIPKINMVAWIYVVAYSISDIIVAFFLIYLFTRVKIKEQFS